MYRIRIQRPYQKPNIDICTDDAPLYEALCAFYRPFIINRVDHSDTTIEVCYYSNDSVFTVNGKSTEIPRDYALQAVENIIYESTTMDDGVFAIHGGVVGVNGKAFILTGSTESGKSTLTAYLVNQGFDYISDDIALIRERDLKVLPFPRPLQLREGGVRVLEQYGIHYGDCSFFEYGNIKRMIVCVKPLDQHEYPIEGICFIKRNETENVLRPIPKHKAFIYLLKNRFIYQHPEAEQVKTISNLAKMNVFELLYYNMDFVRDTLRGFHV